MKITPIKTGKIEPDHNCLYRILDQYLVSFKENSILVITSKIIAICQNRVVKINKTSHKEQKHKLIRKEADYYLNPEENKYKIMLTIKDGLLMPSAGIDESNGNGYFILWPNDKQKVANSVRSYLKRRFNLKKAGVIITDSKTTPLRWGTTGTGLAHSGFLALNNYIGKPDIFGRNLLATKANILDGLATAAVVVIGEGKEQTPLAVIEDIPFVKFQAQNPSKNQLKNLKISLEDDVYAAILKSVKWKKGRNKK